MTEDNPDIRAQLARMEGKQDVTNERLANLSALQDERHEAVKGDIRDIRETQQRHGTRIGALETARVMGEGERKGVALSTKVAVGIVTLASGGLGALIVRLAQ